MQKFMTLLNVCCKNCDNKLVEKPAFLLYGTGVILYCKHCGFRNEIEIERELKEGRDYVFETQA